MANVANTPATGPVSKDVHSGGQKMPMPSGMPRGPITKMTNNNEAVRAAIMGMRFSTVIKSNR